MSTLCLLFALATIPAGDRFARFDRDTIDLRVTYDHSSDAFFDRPPLALWTRRRFIASKFQGRRFSYGVYGVFFHRHCGFGIECWWFPMGTGESCYLFFDPFDRGAITFPLGVPPNVTIRFARKGGAA